jgi:murein L,D-transpeptidase YafK
MTALKIIIFFLIITGFMSDSDFLNEQKKFERVKDAFNQKSKKISNKLQTFGISLEKLNILIVAYKDEKQLEVYAKNAIDNKFKLIQTYYICASSGVLGPKRKEGDGQVPEGFYIINRFNPNSNFYLSLGINYPNQSDKKKSKYTKLGGDIFIHGSCVTIGCIPMTNDKIMEIYIYAVQSRHNGQTEIPVYIFPFKMTNKNFVEYKSLYKNDKDLIDFWTNLKLGYDKFYKDKKKLNIHFDNNGNYCYY